MNDEMLEMFSELSVIFKTYYQDPIWSKYKKDDAANLFIAGYAFEHQGRSPSFSPAAIDAIEKAKGSTDFAANVWENFSKSVNKNSANKINPLCHSLCNSENEKKCIWCALDSKNILLDSKRDLESGDIKNAWGRLQRIRGVGPKIASLFLRDVAVWYNIDENLKQSDGERWRLQPIDIWIRRIVELRSPDMQDKRYEDVAKWIVENCEKPEHSNQGMWYFGARIVGSEMLLDRSLQDMDQFKNTIKGHIAHLQATSNAAMEFGRKMLI